MASLDQPLSKKERRLLELKYGSSAKSAPKAKPAPQPARASEHTISQARSFFSEGRGDEDMRVQKKCNCYLVDESWRGLAEEIARGTTSEGMIFLESDGTTKRTAVFEQHFQSTGAIKWMCTDATAILYSDVAKDPAHYALPTDIIGIVENRPTKAEEVAKLPATSTLRVSEGFDSANLVLDALGDVIKKPHGKPMVAVLPTDSGGSTENQQTYAVRLHEENHKESDVIFFPDFCRVHMSSISGRKGFDKFCNINMRDPRVVEKQIYLAVH